MQPVPTVNVNLKSCSCGRSMLVSGVEYHAKDCAGRPIPLPCPLPPSVTFEVRLGECICGGRETFHSTTHDRSTLHLDTCPGRPIRVSCSIGGDGTWAGSMVTSVALVEKDEHGNTTEREAGADAFRIASERWALVKALVLGARRVESDQRMDPVDTFGLFVQRDAVYAALADMARAEDAAFNAQVALGKAVKACGFSDLEGVSSDTEERPSAGFMRVYIEHLIEQVRVLP